MSKPEPDRLARIILELGYANRRHYELIGDIINRLNSVDSPDWEEKFKKTIADGVIENSASS